VPRLSHTGSAESLCQSKATAEKLPGTRREEVGTGRHRQQPCTTSGAIIWAGFALGRTDDLCSLEQRPRWLKNTLQHAWMPVRCRRKRVSIRRYVVHQDALLPEESVPAVEAGQINIARRSLPQKGMENNEHQTEHTSALRIQTLLFSRHAECLRPLGPMMENLGRRQSLNSAQ
jgi:hypothetical protein